MEPQTTHSYSEHQVFLDVHAAVQQAAQAHNTLAIASARTTCSCGWICAMCTVHLRACVKARVSAVIVVGHTKQWQLCTRCQSRFRHLRGLMAPTTSRYLCGKIPLRTLQKVKGVPQRRRTFRGRAPTRAWQRFCMPEKPNASTPQMCACRRTLSGLRSVGSRLWPCAFQKNPLRRPRPQRKRGY